MKKRLLTHGISLLLVLSLLLSLFACARPQEDSASSEGQRLTVRELDVTYSEELREHLSHRGAELLARLLRLRDGLVVPEETREELAVLLREGYLPLFERERVSEEELKQVLALAEAFCEELERSPESSSEGGRRGDRMLTLCALYRDLIATLGTERGGHVAYGGLCYYLEGQISYYEERFEAYGLPWYEREAKDAERRLTTLREDVGEAVFTDAMCVPAFAASVAAGALPEADAGMGTLLYDGDLVAILQRQGDFFTSLEVSEYQWYVLGDVFSAFGGDGSESLTDGVLAALRDEGMPARVGTCVPQALSLYSAFADKLDAKIMGALREAEDEDERARILCGLLSGCEEELLVFLEKFESTCVTSGDRQRAVIENEGLTDAFATFEAEETAYDAAGFADAIAACAEGEESGERLYAATLRYLRGTLPYLAFAMDTENRKG